ncbi:unnamed protein product [Caenorhabditis bovis]|uniref:Uncharacterized protein n=1 Tax=Caenorhabditis bovis TaxID=2654633 RepID=A0A8S1ED91_9PELO|nr:unnamed protein product [Caenorhabditis bovis]
MRRAGGFRIRNANQKLALLKHTTIDDRRIAPSLKAVHLQKILEERAHNAEPTLELTTSENPRRVKRTSTR